MDKRCTECGTTKSATEFYPKRAKCKLCIRASVSKRGKEQYHATQSTADKRCVECHKTKPASSFTPTKNQCKACVQSLRRVYFKTPAGKAAIKKSNSSPVHAKSRLKWQRTDKGRASMKRRNANSREVRKADPGRKLEHNVMVKVRHMVTGMRMDESATLQKHTGFATRQAILDHLESLFDDRMNFGNYGRHELRDAMRVGNICFSDEFFTTTSSVGEAKRTLEDELRNFCILVEAAKTPFGKVKKTYSGKVGGRNDDLVITLQLAITGIRTFYQQSRYDQFRPESNRTAGVSQTA